MKKKIAVILSGCGFKDGSEINEAVFTLLSIEEQNSEHVCFAPDIDQYHVVNHVNDQVIEESRNVLIESARIARGDISNLNDLQADNFDAVIVVGGFGVAKNLSNFGYDAENFKINNSLLEKLNSFKDLSKPCGFVCIAPILIGKVFDQQFAKATIGSDQSTSSFLKEQGVDHQDCEVNKAVVDEKNKVVSTPAFMLANSLIEARAGISVLVERLIALI